MDEVLGLAKYIKTLGNRNNYSPESCDFYRGPRNPTTLGIDI
jgi:hypothetical protein